MATLTGKRAEWWFGKRTSKAPGTEAGTDAQDRWGKVSGTGRWFSYDWWFGHHFDRDSDGKFGDDDHARRRASFGGSGQLGQRGGRQSSAQKRKRAQAEYGDYLHERYQAAEKATNGYMVTPAGRRRGYTGADFFNIDARRRPGMKWATDELRAWFGHGSAAAGTKGARGGGVLSFTAWQEQNREKAAA